MRIKDCPSSSFAKIVAEEVAKSVGGTVVEYTAQTRVFKEEYEPEKFTDEGYNVIEVAEGRDVMGSVSITSHYGIVTVNAQSERDAMSHLYTFVSIA
jgi:hypothetical protein